MQRNVNINYLQYIITKYSMKAQFCISFCFFFEQGEGVGGSEYLRGNFNELYNNGNIVFPERASIVVPLVPIYSLIFY